MRRTFKRRQISKPVLRVKRSERKRRDVCYREEEDHGADRDAGREEACIVGVARQELAGLTLVTDVSDKTWQS